MNLFELAESPLWDEQRESWFFVDIPNGELHELSLSAQSKTFKFGQMISNVVKTERGYLISLEDKLIEFLIDNGRERIKILCSLEHDKAMRMNDGAVGPDGRFYFGTMEKKPSGLNGKIYSVDAIGKVTEQGAEIGIPNSFVWINKRYVLISDSYLQKTFKVELLESGLLDWSNRQIWLDLSDTSSTPDGGALDEEGNVWLAIWGGACICKYSPEGELLEKTKLKALQPTSCAFGGLGMNELFVTTASEGMSADLLKVYPESGAIVHLKLGVKGSELPPFKADNLTC